MKWNVTPSSPLPIYQQLSQQIREAVAQGVYSQTSSSLRFVICRNCWSSIRTRLPEPTQN